MTTTEMHVAVHPVAYRGKAQRLLKGKNMEFEMYYWRRVAKGEAPISWNEACSLLSDYDGMHNEANVPCVVKSPLTHKELFEQLSNSPT